MATDVADHAVIGGTTQEERREREKKKKKESRGQSLPGKIAKYHLRLPGRGCISFDKHTTVLP